MFRAIQVGLAFAVGMIALDKQADAGILLGLTGHGGPIKTELFRLDPTNQSEFAQTQLYDFNSNLNASQAGEALVYNTGTGKRVPRIRGAQ